MGAQRRKALSLGGPAGPMTGQKDFSEEVIFKLGFGGKTMSKLLQKSFLRGFS